MRLIPNCLLCSKVRLGCSEQESVAAWSGGETIIAAPNSLDSRFSFSHHGLGESTPSHDYEYSSPGYRSGHQYNDEHNQSNVGAPILG